MRMKTCNEPSFAQEKAANRLCFEWGAGSRPWSFTPSKRPDAVAQSLSRGAGWGGACDSPSRPLGVREGTPCRTGKTLDVRGRQFCFTFQPCR